MKKTEISKVEFDKKKVMGCGKRFRSEELEAIYELNQDACCCLSYQSETEFEKARARIAGIKQRFPEMFEYFTDKKDKTIYVKKYRQEEL